jgi:glyoxylase-like metal-dependent hydrolase (beta-lactamase superfamily II)
VLPPSYRRISHGDEISIGTRRFKVITGGGHALDQVMLYCAADKLFLSADQVLSKISPNVSVWAVEPDQNSLGEYLASLASLTTTLPYDLLVLPGRCAVLRLKTRIKIGRSPRGTLRADCRRRRKPRRPRRSWCRWCSTSTRSTSTRWALPPAS